ncbi:MAG: glutamine--fructose-6-phosphate transaminase (isomerizing), partial [Desulfurococcaceae archaeon]
GVICRDNIPAGVVFEGLRRLIYRGYDGAGLAILRNEHIEIRKAAGHLLNISKQIDFININSPLAVGHTRYASRGWPVYENTHPLLDCSGRIAVVGDGIIENYEEVKLKLEKAGHVFKSRTDTEVAVHFFEEHLRKKSDMIEALISLALELSGNYALVFMVAPEKKLYFVQHGQPIVIGMSPDKNCIYVSSDLPSLYGFADVAYIIDDNNVGAISLDTLEIYNASTGQKLDLANIQSKRVKYMVEYVEKGGYPHFMIKEIHEVPDALINTTLAIMEKYLRLSSMIVHGARKVFIIGTGTSYHAALTATYYFSELAGVSVIPVSAAEFPYSMLENVETGTVIIGISQSGETSDVINSVKLAKQRGAVIVGVTNNVGSRLALESNVYLPVGAGPELAVPATKTFTSTLTALLLLASYTGIFAGKRTMQDHKLLIEEIREFSRKIKEYIPIIEEKAVGISNSLKNATGVYVASSGITYPIAIEGALKLKEAALIHAEGYQLGELRHGPLSIVAPSYPVLVIEPFEEQAHPLFLKVLGELETRRANVISIESKLKTKYCSIELPRSSKYLYPISSSVALQLIAYYAGVAKGLPVDTPPGLAKTVTT